MMMLLPKGSSSLRVSMGSHGSEGRASPSDRCRMVFRVSLTSRLPSRKTSRRVSFMGSPLPSVIVTNWPFFFSRVSLPVLDFLPGSVIGSLTTSTPSPLTLANEHLKAHFRVSRCIFCSRAPPLPNTKLSAAQPPFFMARSTCSRVLMSMPSPWITLMQSASLKCPVEVSVVPNLLSNFSSTRSTTPGRSPLSGRTTKVPSRFSICSLRSVPQYCSHA
mmetsp:Transcript_2907/g.6700  ORF Transcript_2907/g.6700 Transcript_2907/m.6700 type:complete len:218 (+) Transcript_2907:1472-2125(+)